MAEQTIYQQFSMFKHGDLIPALKKLLVDNNHTDINITRDYLAEAPASGNICIKVFNPNEEEDYQYTIEKVTRVYIKDNDVYIDTEDSCNIELIDLSCDDIMQLYGTIDYIFDMGYIAFDRNGKQLYDLAKIKWYDPAGETDSNIIWQVDNIANSELVYCYNDSSEMECPPDELEIVD